MTVDLITLVKIRRRMEELAVPLLSHEIRTPQRTAQRVARIMRWMGPMGRAVTRDYVRLGSKLPTDTRRRWGRGGALTDRIVHPL